MNYKEIRLIGNLEDQHRELTKFYEETIGVNDWLTSPESQTIAFKDRIEHRFGGLMHSTISPAIEPRKEYNGTNQISEEYYINGQHLSYEDWKNKTKELENK